MQLIDNLTISTNKDRLNIKMIHDYLSNRSYWAINRTLEEVKLSIVNSICFGVYYENKQIGFARVVTDKVVFAWVLDVFVLEECRGKGVGKYLMDAIVKYHELKNVKRIGLATNDAHGLYSQFGFSSLSKPENMMERI